MKKEAQLVATEKRKHDALACILVETGMVEIKDKEIDNNQPSSILVIKVEATKNLVNESPWRHHFGKWYWDKTVTLAAKRAVYLLCHVLYKQYRTCLIILVFDYFACIVMTCLT